MTWIVVSSDGLYFSGWCAQLAPRYDGDDESFVTVAGWSANWEHAKVFLTQKTADRVTEKIGTWRAAVVE
jgi:hypothetical protein